MKTKGKPQWVFAAVLLMGGQLCFAPVASNGQLELASEVDVGIQDFYRPRYGPSMNSRFQGSHRVVAVDPVNPDLRAIGFINFPAGTTRTESWVNRPFEQRPIVDIEVTPNELTLETEIYLNGPQEEYRFLRLGVLDGSGPFVALETTNTTSGQLLYPGTGGQVAVPTSQPLGTNGWRTLRINYRGATTPGESGSNDGQVQVWMKDGIADEPWRHVASTNNSNAGKVGNLGIGLQPINASATSSAYFRRFAWESGMVTPDQHPRLWKDYSANLGTQWPDGADGIAQRFVFHYDRNLNGAGSGVRAKIEYTTPDDAHFTNAVSTAPVPLSDASQWTNSVIATGLDPNSAYLYRTVYEVANGASITTAPGNFKTLSAPNGEPGIIRFAFGACTGLAPYHAQHLMLEDDLNFMMHLGDINYNDNQMKLHIGSDWGERVGAEDYGRYWSRVLTESTWQELHTNVPLVPVWDDHDVRDAWAGKVFENGTPRQQNMLASGEAAANVWLDSYQPPNVAFGGVKYKPDAPAGYTADNVHYFHYDTARSRFIVLDTRRFKDTREGSRQLLGPEQLLWALDLLKDTQQPLVFLASSIPWSSLKFKIKDRWLAFEEYEEERQALFDAALSNPVIERVILLSGDNHFAVVADPFPDNPRLGPEFLVGALSSSSHSASHDEYEGLIYGPDNLGRNAPPVRLYGLIEVDKINGTVSYTLKHGETGETRFRMSLGAVVPLPASCWMAMFLFALMGLLAIVRRRTRTAVPSRFAR